ncbi:hypothetical protein BDZ88DRAFT_417906 [Geranomyces variabilis]|nr:hypothetical protein BDZ88DRAFT_417906 [Geranomyces variabilis]
MCCRLQILTWLCKATSLLCSLGSCTKHAYKVLKERLSGSRTIEMFSRRARLLRVARPGGAASLCQAHLHIYGMQVSLRKGLRE